MTDETTLKRGDMTTIHGMGGRRIARLGYIGLGFRGEKNGKRSIGEAGHFVFSDQALEDFPEIGDLYVHRATGEIAPKRLDVMFTTDDRREVFPHAYELSANGRPRCRGNGQTAVRSLCNECKRMMCKHYDGERHDVEMACPCELLDQKRCKPTGRLTFMLYKATRAGVWTVTTRSWNSIRDILAGLDQVEKDAGRLAYVPCELRLVRAKLKHDGKVTWKHILKLGVDRDIAYVRGCLDDIPPPIAAFEPAEATPEDVLDGTTGEEEARSEKRKARETTTGRPFPSGPGGAGPTSAGAAAPSGQKPEAKSEKQEARETATQGSFGDFTPGVDGWGEAPWDEREAKSEKQEARSERTATTTEESQPGAAVPHQLTAEQRARGIAAVLEFGDKKTGRPSTLAAMFREHGIPAANVVADLTDEQLIAVGRSIREYERKS